MGLLRVGVELSSCAEGVKMSGRLAHFFFPKCDPRFRTLFNELKP